MASSLWKISLGGGAAVSAASLGLERLVVTRRSFDVSELTFVHRRADAFAAALIPYLTTVALYRGADLWFTGRVTTCATSADGAGAEEDRYTVSDGWWMLERIIYEQPFVMQNEDFTGLIGSLSTRVVLGQDAWGRKISAESAAMAISTFAYSRGSGLTVSISGFGGFLTPPWLEARDITCAAALRMLGGLVPDLVAYTNPAGVMQITRRGSLGYATIAANVPTQIALRERPDLKPTGVILSILTSEEDESTGRRYTRETRQTAGTTTGQGVAVATIQLGESETVPSGLAADYFSALNYTPWEGSITVHEQECTRMATVGQLLNLSGGRAEWAAMNAVVIGSTEDIDRGETTLQVGAAGALSLSSFVELMSFWRRNTTPSDWPDKRHNGTEGVADGATEPGVDGVGGPAPALEGDPADEEGKVPEADRVANPDAGRPWGGPGSGAPGAPSTVSGKTDTVQKCVDGIQQSVAVLRAP